MRSPRTHVVLAAALALVVTGSNRSRIDAAPDAPQQVSVPPVYEPVGEYRGFTYVGRPHRPDGAASRVTSPFVVTYNGFTPEAQAAFQYAVDIWGSVVQSPVPIRVTANFRTDLPPYVLGAAGTTTLVRDFQNAPKARTYYPAALANARAGVDLVSGDEIVANFNANFDWYLGTDGNARNKFDFATVVLHELGHGLGFYGSLRVENGVGVWGFGGSPSLPVVYDQFLTDGSQQTLLDTTRFPNGSAQLGSALVSRDVHFTGTATRAADKDAAHIFAPAPWVPGSSMLHLADELYPAGDVNSLMTPALSPAEVIHDPGPLATAMLADMGWPLAAPSGPPPAPPMVTGLRLFER